MGRRPLLTSCYLVSGVGHVGSSFEALCRSCVQDGDRFGDKFFHVVPGQRGNVESQDRGYSKAFVASERPGSGVTLRLLYQPQLRIKVERCSGTLEPIVLPSAQCGCNTVHLSVGQFFFECTATHTAAYLACKVKSEGLCFVTCSDRTLLQIFPGDFNVRAKLPYLSILPAGRGSEINSDGDRAVALVLRMGSPRIHHRTSSVVPCRDGV